MMNRRLSVVIALVVLSVVLSAGAMPVAAADPICETTNENDYTVTLCITKPADFAVVSGNVKIKLTRSTTGSPPAVDRLIVKLNGDYLLSDYVPHYKFKIPTATFADGNYELRVYELYHNDDESDETVLRMTFNNGNVTAPPNNKTFKIHVPTVGSSPVLVASIGDSADGERPAISDRLIRWNPDMVLYLGDVYGRGTYTEFFNWYHPYLGAVKSITNPIVGNHEYDSDDEASGYFYYWDNVPNYYSYNVGNWLFIALDTNNEFDQIDPGTPQYEWLVQQLANTNRPCKAVYMHHPPMTAGRPGIGNDVGDAFWQLFVQYNVDLVTTGHEHQYQRWYPLDEDGNINDTGPVLIVNGTGGHHVDPFQDTDPRIAVGLDDEDDSYGAMKLKLYPNRMKFKFINEHGTMMDKGTIQCSGTNPPPPPPSPTDLVSPDDDATVTDDTPVFVWDENPSSENVTLYKLIIKNHKGKKKVVQTVPASSCDGECSFDLASTSQTLGNKTFTWSVKAINAGGSNKSDKWSFTVDD